MSFANWVTSIMYNIMFHESKIQKTTLQGHLNTFSIFEGENMRTRKTYIFIL